MLKKLSVLIILFSLLSCNRFNNKENSNIEKRIVCLSKHLTEYMFALGLGNKIVAVDLSSTYPDSAKLLKTVGYHRALNPEGIISLSPDLVIHSNDIGPETVLPQIVNAGLKVESFGKANTIDSAKIVIHQLSQYFKATQNEQKIITKMDDDLKLAATKLEQLKLVDTPKVMVIHFGRANNVYFVMSGRNGCADKMIELAGGKVAKYDAKGARQISAEAIATANPDIIIATDFGYDQMGSMDKFIEGVPGVSLTNAGKNKKIVRFEEHDLVYFGPRSGENIIKLIDLIHPVH